MKTPKVSVIIPVYNAEKTIGGILEKLITQAYKNIEVIAVNDGSEDRSLKVIEGFSSKDNRVLVVNQVNAGVSTARNVGISKATGEFITFVDADDDFSVNLIVELVAASSDDIDFVMCGMSINGKEVVAEDSTIEGYKPIVSYVLGSLLTKNLFYGPYCKLFRRSVVDELCIKFPEKVRYGEDTIFILNYLRNTRKLTILNKSLYLYNFQTTGLAIKNNRNLSFRAARTKAFNEFVLNRLSAYSAALYVLVRLRWSLALLKSQLQGIVQ